MFVLLTQGYVVWQEVHDGKHGAMRFAVASSADTPRAVEIGKAAMRILEVPCDHIYISISISISIYIGVCVCV